MEKENKDTIIKFKISTREKEEIKKYAESANKTMSQLIREAIQLMMSK